MVFFAVKWSLRLASCWSVEVMKGAAGFRLRSPRVTLLTRQVAPWSPVMTLRVSASEGRLAFSPLTSRRVAVKSGGFLPLSRAHGDRLNAPGREAAPDLLPEERRELVADEPIEHAPGLLRVHLLDVDLARVQEGGLDRALGDLVEHDPMRLGLGHAQLLREMPADRLALAVRVGGDVERVDLLGGLFQLVEHLLLGGQDTVVGLEAFLLVDAQLALGQVADMAHRGPHDKGRIQILLDRLDLRGRLHDH